MNAEGSAPSASGPTRLPFSPSESSSSHLVLFECLAVILFVVSFFWMRRRRRQLEARMELRYDRLSRVELGTVDGTVPSDVHPSQHGSPV